MRQFRRRRSDSVCKCDRDLRQFAARADAARAGPLFDGLAAQGQAMQTGPAAAGAGPSRVLGAAERCQ